ncbi:hypothetical protein RQP46_000648 [Phenoliferia psychrophenolica]
MKERMYEVRRGGPHRLPARAAKSSAGAAVAAAAKAATTAKVVASTAATAKTVVASTATPTGAVNTSYSPGVAATGTNTAVAPTTPPSGGSLAYSSAKSTFSGSFASLNTASYSPAFANGTGGSAKPVLSPTALIAIIAASGAVVVAVIAMFGCWCWKKRKAKRDEAQWWQVDASQNGGRRSVGGNPIPGKATRLADSEVWGKGEVDAVQLGEKHAWGGAPHDHDPSAYDDPRRAPTGGGAPFSSYAPSGTTLTPSAYEGGSLPPASPSLYPDTPALNAREQREMLLGLGPMPTNSRNTLPQLPPSDSDENPFEDAPRRPRRPSNAATFIVPDADSASRATKRKSMKPNNKKDTIMNFTNAYGDDALASEGWDPAPPDQSAPRVDSKPLKELEDILDSFAMSSLQRQTLPPLPDTESLRNSTVSSGEPSVAPLTLTRIGESSLPYRQMSMSGPSAPASSYALSHSVSVYSSAGDIGELPGGDVPPLPVGGLAAMLAAPASATSRTAGGGQTRVGVGRKPAYRSGASDTSTLSELADFPSPNTDETHFVRKVSLTKVAPTQAERDIVSQMGLDSLGLESPKSSRSPSPSALSISPPETPRDFTGGPFGGLDARKLDPLAGTGFVPLNAMSLDPGAMSYRSATESIYGMYDDLPADLKALPRDDPRVSRHISMFGLGPR